MKKTKMILAVGAMAAILAGCGQGTGSETTPAATVQETEETTATVLETEETTTAVQETEKPEETTAAPSESPDDSEGYEDNFSVDAEKAAEFGREIKEAVAAKDLEKLAELTAFPVYVGFEEGGESVETKEDFISLGADRIFTEELAASVEAADETALSPSMAGFVLSNESGKPNIVFGVREGKLAISGINY